MTSNVDVEDGLTNGAGSIVKSFTQGAAGVTIVWVRFSERSAGQRLRNKTSFLFKQNPHVNQDWTPVQRREETIKPRGFTGLEVLRRQFPLPQGNACTTIKSQGRTSQRMNTNCRTTPPGSKNKTAGKPGSHYVQCSRVTTLDGLAISDLAEEQITCDEAVEDVMQNMRENHNLQQNLLSRSASLCMQEHIKSNIVVAAWNCVTLRDTDRGHLADAQANDTLQFADVVFLCETKLCAEDNLQRAALTTPHTEKAVVAHHPAKNNTTGGCMLQVNTRFAKQHIGWTGSTHETEAIQTTVLKPDMPPVTIIGVYNPPAHSVTHLTDILQEILPKNTHDPLVILGDFNIDLSSSRPEDTRKAAMLHSFMQSCHLEQHVTLPTHRRGGLLDHIWTNCRHLAGGVVMSYCSDHDIIWAALDSGTSPATSPQL